VSKIISGEWKRFFGAGGEPLTSERIRKIIKPPD